jgi:hypothetical protein
MIRSAIIQGPSSISEAPRHESLGREFRERIMADPQPNDPQRKRDWLTGVRESNAVGWLALAALVIVIVVSTIVFGGQGSKVATTETPATSVAR